MNPSHAAPRPFAMGPPRRLDAGERDVAELYEMGAVLSSHRNHGRLSVVTCLCFAIMAAVVFFFVGDWLGVSSDNLATVSTMSAVVFGLLLKILPWFVPPKGGRIWVWLHEQGLVFNFGNDGYLPVRWADIARASYSGDLRYTHGGMAYRRFARLELVGNADGVEFALDLVHYTRGAHLYKAVQRGWREHR